MNSSMATRTPKTPGSKAREYCTEFQLHKSQMSSVDSRRVIDYTSHRLMRYIEATTDEQQRQTLQNLLQDYKAGKVAIAWKSGKPVWMQVTKA